mmetsp:Transcript_31999/g.95837  ORF Transcript_31999/g.95837 Transcript_31999/m.95837 type:complete len:366 (+) Transcript_31999:2962-4059(+)
MPLPPSPLSLGRVTAVTVRAGLYTATALVVGPTQVLPQNLLDVQLPQLRGRHGPIDSDGAVLPPRRRPQPQTVDRDVELDGDPSQQGVPRVVRPDAHSVWTMTAMNINRPESFIGRRRGGGNAPVPEAKVMQEAGAPNPAPAGVGVRVVVPGDIPRHVTPLDGVERRQVEVGGKGHGHVRAQMPLRLVLPGRRQGERVTRCAIALALRRRRWRRHRRVLADGRRSRELRWCAGQAEGYHDAGRNVPFASISVYFISGGAGAGISGMDCISRRRRRTPPRVEDPPQVGLAHIRQHVGRPRGRRPAHNARGGGGGNRTRGRRHGGQQVHASVFPPVPAPAAPGGVDGLPPLVRAQRQTAGPPSTPQA